MRPHRKLIVWQKAMAFYVEIYTITNSYPKDELFGLVSQTRRAALSIPSNIAEEAARNTTKENLQFLGHASGYLSELDTPIEASQRVGLLSTEQSQHLITQGEEISAMLIALPNSLRRKSQ